MQDIAHLRGLIALQDGDVDKTLTWFNIALRLEPKPAAALEQAAILGGSGHPKEGLSHLDFYATLEVAPMRPNQGMPWLHQWILERQGYWPQEIQRMRLLLNRDAQNGNQ